LAGIASSAEKPNTSLEKPTTCAGQTLGTHPSGRGMEKKFKKIMMVERKQTHSKREKVNRDHANPFLRLWRGKEGESEQGREDHRKSRCLTSRNASAGKSVPGESTFPEQKNNPKKITGNDGKTRTHRSG